MFLYTVYRRNCCSRNRRVCIYNNMYNECHCTPSIRGTVVVVIVGFVFTTTCTCCCKYKPYDYDYNSSSYRRCTKTFIVHVVVNTNPTITTTTVPPIDVYKDIHCTCCCKYKPYNYDYNSSSYRRCTMTFIVHVVVNTNPTITTTTVPPIDGVQRHSQLVQWMSLYTVYRRNCCSRNSRVCIYNNMYNECLCTPSIGGTVVVVIVGFVFTATCTMNVFVHRLYEELL
jgi:hypothetical protein